jgi:hypothetical protein
MIVTGPAARGRGCVARCRSGARRASIQTTGDVYADWDIDQLADTMKAVLEGENESFPPSLAKPLQNGD